MGINTELREAGYLRQERDAAYLEALKRGTPIALYVRGISMYPYIKDYDFLDIEPFLSSQARIGDVVMVESDSALQKSFFIHRLVRIKREGKATYYYTKGDNAGRLLEGPFEGRQITGRVVVVARKGRHINCRTHAHRVLSRIFAFFSLYSPAILKIVCLFYNSLRERAFIRPLRRVFEKDPLAFNTQELAVLLLRDTVHNEGFRQQAIFIIAEGLRWNYFCTLAIAHGRTVAAEKNIGILEKLVHIPPFVHTRLKEEALNAMVEAERLHRHCVQIMKSFSAAHIDTVSLKGTFLSELLYRDTAARGVSNDIDILIEEKDIAPSVRLLESIGYMQSPEEEVEAWRWHKEMVLTGSPTVDLHWDITMMKRDPQRIAGLWEQATMVRLADEAGEWQYYRLQGEALLVYLGVSIIHSKGYATLKYYFDIDRLLSEKENPLRWDFLIECASCWKVKNSVFAALSQSKKMLGSTIPSPALAALKPSLLKRLFIAFFLSRSVIFSNNIRRRILDSFLSYILFELLEAESLRDLVFIASRVLFPPRRALEMSAYAPNGGAVTSRTQYWICIVKRLGRGFCKTAKLLKG
ncbi:MAG: nucleotidyltransferase family protein [Candidatus Omnitrophota bacterium]